MKIALGKPKLPSKLTDKKASAAKEKPAKKATVAKGSRRSKFVFLIGDEGAILVYIKNNAVQNRHFVPDASAQNLSELKEHLESDPKAPILLVVDNMDQSYVQQTLPPVSSMSVKKLMKRRLDRDFGVNDIKGALVLGREESGRKDWNFMMVALEKTPLISLWMDFVLELPNRFAGLYLLAVEMKKTVQDLEIAMGVPKEGTGSEWKFFVSHNKVGGFRQVILRNGQFIFTRMTQPVGELTPEVIAGNIEQEMLSTIEYMKRLGFDWQAGLDIYVVVSSAIKDAIDKAKFSARQITLLSPFEVSQYLGIEGASQPTDQFGDVVLAASIGCSKKHVLPLSTPQSKKFEMIYQMLWYEHLIIAFAVVGMFGYAASLGYDCYSAYRVKSELEERKSSHQKTLDALHAEIAQSNIDIDKTNDTIDLFQQLALEERTPLPFIAQFITAIDPPVRIKSIKWTWVGNDTKAAAGVPGAMAGGAQAAPPSKMVAVFVLQFMGVETIPDFKSVSQKALADMKQKLKGYDISYTKIPTKFVENEKLDLTFGAQTAAASQDKSAYDVELTIKGDIDPAAAAKAAAKPAGAPVGMIGGMRPPMAPPPSAP